MSQPPAQEIYVFDRSQTDQERLPGIARARADFAREACLRAGLKPGDRAIDVGCGPVGALLVLAELVGPAGAVVGLDASAEALTPARQILDRHGLGTVRLIRADINATDLEAVPPGAPFDL